MKYLHEKKIRLRMASNVAEWSFVSVKWVLLHSSAAFYVFVCVACALPHKRPGVSVVVSQPFVFSLSHDTGMWFASRFILCLCIIWCIQYFLKVKFLIGSFVCFFAQSAPYPPRGETWRVGHRVSTCFFFSVTTQNKSKTIHLTCVLRHHQTKREDNAKL